MLVGDTVAHFRSEEHLRTLHIVEDSVFKFGLQSVCVNEVEVHFFVSGYLHANVALDVVKRAALVQLEVIAPGALTSNLVFHLLEKKHET